LEKQKNLATHRFFELFSLPIRFEINRAELDQRFRQLQAVVHPDKFANASAPEHRDAAEQSMNINDAYQTLKDPVKRAMLICAVHGHEVNLNTNTAMSSLFLVEQMQLREQLEDVLLQAKAKATLASDSEDQLNALQENVELARRTRLAQLNCYLDIDNNPAQAVTVIKELMFFNKLAVEVDDAQVFLQN
jgi:molecular chaperone HscB